MAVPVAPSGGVDGGGDDEEDHEGCMSASGSTRALDAGAPPGVGSVEDKARNSAIADSWSTLTDGEKITPCQVGDVGVGDGGGEATHIRASACTNPSR